MKTIFNKQKRSIVGVTVALLAFAAAITGCQKDFELDLPLAVSSRNLSLTKEAGSTHVLVYSNGEWTAHLTRNVKWASINKQEGYGNNEIVFSYSANYGISRKVGVVFSKGGLRDTVMFTQAGAVTEPSLVFAKPAVTLLKSSSAVKSAISTNLRYSIDDMEATVTYYDENDMPNDPVKVVTRADAEGEEGGEEGGEETPVAQPVDPWISDVVITRSAVTFAVSENATGFPRRADLNVFIEDADGKVTNSTLSITQGIADPVFRLDESEVTYEGYAQDCVVAATNNNIEPYADKVLYEVVYEGGEPEEPWIAKPAITSDGLTFKLLKNDTEAARTAVIKLTYADELGNEVAAECKVVQKMYPAAVDFASVRALAPGEIALQQYIEGFIVSDAASANICSSPQTAQFAFDRSENNKTAYIESTDAKYGFALKFATSDDAKLLERYSKVRIAINGLTLEKHENPDYYTIKGLTAANILEATTADEFKVPVKTKTIAELTDDDIFTLVSVSNLEIMCKDGAYTNSTEGYLFKDGHSPCGTSSAPRYDVVPLLCYDMNGDAIRMLTNCGVSWRRTGADLKWNTVVPQGAGTFKGVVVADDIVTVRYGNIGRYQLRAMTAEDIALNDAPFAQTIVEWNWNNLKTDLDPEIGTGTINKYGASQAGAADFNNPYHCNGKTDEKNGNKTNQKGLVNLGGLRLDNTWWDFTKNEGKYFDIEFSTQGISGSNMTFGIVWGTGDMGGTNIKAPANWNLLYSVDGGESFQPVPNSDPVKCRCIVWWDDTKSGGGATPNDAAPGFTEHLRKLPAECFGKEKVVLRLQAASTVTNINPKASSSNYKTALACEKGNITSSITAANQQVRIGTITVRYN